MTDSPPHGVVSHRRYNPLQDAWVLVSPERTSRPWLGQKEASAEVQRAPYEPSCYLCPGNSRAHGQVNPVYEGVYVFDNDFPALAAPTACGSVAAAKSPAPNPEHPLLRSQTTTGTCRVVCFSPRHDLTLAQLPASAVERVIEIWQRETEALGREHAWVQVFENKGAAMGCSNPHPHGQIWATSTLPGLAATEDHTQRRWLKERGVAMLLEYGDLESQRRQRIVSQNEHWLVVVPHWAVWPFETLLLPTRRVERLTTLDATQRQSLAAILSDLLIRYDNLFETSFPYSMGWHGAPFVAGADTAHWTLHAHFFPPLLRSADVRKFMVGYEMLAEPQRDLLPERVAELLRTQPTQHFTQRSVGNASPTTASEGDIR